MSASFRYAIAMFSTPHRLRSPHANPPPPPFPVPSMHRKAVSAQVMRRYHIQDRDDYKKYNKLCGEVTHLVTLLKRLDARDSTPHRAHRSAA